MDEIRDLEVITGIDYITQSTYETMRHQVEVLNSHGVDVLSKTKGIERFKNYFDSYSRYIRKRLPTEPVQKIRIINPTPDFLEG